MKIMANLRLENDNGEAPILQSDLFDKDRDGLCILAAYSTQELTFHQREVRSALAVYKMAFIKAHYCDCWRRLAYWMGDRAALDAQATLASAEEEARVVVNRSPEHQVVIRLISSQHNYRTSENRGLVKTGNLNEHY